MYVVLDCMYVDGIAVALAMALVGFFCFLIHYHFCDICLVHGCLMLDWCELVMGLTRWSLGASGFLDPSKGQSWPHHRRRVYMAHQLGQYLDHPWLHLSRQW